MGIILCNEQNNSLVSDENVQMKKWLRKEAENINVELTNFTVGNVVYVDSRTGETINWCGSGDAKVVPLTTLYSMMASNRNLLKTLILGITDHFYTGTVDLKIEDIVKALDIEEIYSPFNYQFNNVDGIIIKYTVEEFSNLCEKCPVCVVERIAERYKYLRENNYINDKNKEMTLGSLLNRGYIFSNIE